MLAIGAAALLAMGATVALMLGARSLLDRDPRFRIDSSASIETLGNNELSRASLLSVFGSDIGRNLFFVPLEKRRLELEQIPWVERATVMRILPNRLRVAVTERVPIAFVNLRGRIALADANGVILNLTPQQMETRHYSFPVVSGLNPADPLTLRAARMQIYRRFLGDLDASGERASSQLSEVDLSDPDDVRATVPTNGSDLLLHFGDENFLPRWRNYQAHIAEWQQQYPHLASIDLRYDREVVLKMAGDTGATPAPGAKTDFAAAPTPVPAVPQPRHATPAHSTKSPSLQAAKHAPPAKPHRAGEKSHPAAARRKGSA